MELRVTFIHRSKLAFFKSSKTLNLTALVSLQRKMSRCQYCQNGCDTLQSACTSRCPSCVLAMGQVDASHGRVTNDATLAILVNTASVFEL